MNTEHDITTNIQNTAPFWGDLMSIREGVGPVAEYPARTAHARALEARSVIQRAIAKDDAMQAALAV